MVCTKCHVASVQTSNGVHQVRGLEEVDGHKALMAVLCGDVAIVDHVHRIVLDRVEDVSVGIPVEHDDVELCEFR